MLTAGQRIFTCEATGHQGYTFFEALESEVRDLESVQQLGAQLTKMKREASDEIDTIFPEILRARVLQFVQHMTTSRMDDLGMVLWASILMLC